MQQKKKKGKKMEDYWLGPCVIIEITKTSCLLKNKSGTILEQSINICQLKPYLEISDDHDNSTGNTDGPPPEPILHKQDVPDDKEQNMPDYKHQFSSRSDQFSGIGDQSLVRRDHLSIRSQKQ